MGLPVLPQQDSPCTSHGCSACCHDTEMLLTEADRDRLEALRPGEPFWSVAQDGFLQLVTRDEPAVMPGMGRPCWFLGGDGLCTVHEARPEGCRLYPGVFDDDDGAILDAEHCPHTDEFRLPTSAKDAIGRLAARLMAERDARDAR